MIEDASHLHWLHHRAIALRLTFINESLLLVGYYSNRLLIERSVASLGAVVSRLYELISRLCLVHAFRRPLHSMNSFRVNCFLQFQNF
jgi:hypothetical protein